MAGDAAERLRCGVAASLAWGLLLLLLLHCSALLRLLLLTCK